MAPIKQIKSLSLLSEEVVVSSLDEAFIKLDVDKDESEHINQLKKYFAEIPVTVMEQLASQMLNVERSERLYQDMIKNSNEKEADTIRKLLEKKEQVAIVSFTMKLLTNANTRTLKLTQHYVSYEL